MLVYYKSKNVKLVLTSSLGSSLKRFGTLPLGQNVSDALWSPWQFCFSSNVHWKGLCYLIPFVDDTLIFLPPSFVDETFCNMLWRSDFISSFSARFIAGWLWASVVWSCRVFHTWSVIFRVSASSSGNKPCLSRTRLFCRKIRFIHVWLMPWLMPLLSQGGLICGVLLQSCQLIQLLFHLGSYLSYQPYLQKWKIIGSE